MLHRNRFCAAATAAVAAAALALAPAGPTAAAGPAPDPIDVQVLAMTDLHGYISPPTGANGTLQDRDGQPITVGGAAYLSTHLDRAAAGHANSIRVANGDSFTGWQWQVTFTRDEPTIELLNRLGVEVSTVGNHELDVSLDFLRGHMMAGKCADDGAQDCFPTSTGQPFQGARFPFLAANLRSVPGGDHPFPATFVRTVEGADGRTQRVGFIGVTTPGVESIFASYQVGALAAGEMLPSVNAVAERLHAQGIRAIVVLAHEGAAHSGYYDGCDNPAGPVMDLAREATPLVDVVVGGHWHTAFNCIVTDPAGQPRRVLSPGHHGRVFGEVDLKLDPDSGEVLRDTVGAHNVAVTRDVPADPAVRALDSYWNAVGARMWARPLGEVTADITLDRDASGESPLGNLVADAYLGIGQQLRGGRPPQLAVNYPYQVRTPLTFRAGTNPADADGRVLFGESWTVQGRGSSVVVADVSGRNLRAAFEQQWQGASDGSTTFVPLAVSHGVKVRMDPHRRAGGRLLSLTVDGRQVRDRETYRVAMPSRLALGMDGFGALANGHDPVRSDLDYFAFQDWFADQPPIHPPATDRVDVVHPVD